MIVYKEYVLGIKYALNTQDNVCSKVKGRRE